MKPCTLFESLAAQTWRTIARTHRNHIVFGEDAITSVLLDQISTIARQGIVAEDTRPMERTTGCDFEFWIGSKVDGWLRYALQAKKIDVTTQSYRRLDHRSGQRLQVDVLDQYAHANGALPLYCLYNWVTPSTSLQRPPHWRRVPQEQLGCTVTPSTVVKRALQQRGRRTFTWMHSQWETHPWSCLVCCQKCTFRSFHFGSARPNEALPFYHRTLPESLAHLSDLQKVPFSELTEVFAPGEELFPRFLAVLDLGESRD